MTPNSPHRQGTSKSARKRAARQKAAQDAALAAFLKVSPHPEQTSGIPAVDASHRAGKRKRGNSVTKQAPRETSYVTRVVDVFDANGVCIAEGQRMLTYRREA